jgi:hypothetical protein
MSRMSNLDIQLQELARRYYHYLEDQLYDPRPHVDGYDKEHQLQHVTELLHSLATAAADLLLNPADDEEAHFVLVKLNKNGEALCPECNTPLKATIHFDSETVTPWWDDNCWEYMAEGANTYIEQFLCPGCGWTMPYVEPHED